MCPPPCISQQIFVVWVYALPTMPTSHLSHVHRDPCFPLISVDVCVCSTSFCVNRDALGALYSVLNRSECFSSEDDFCSLTSEKTQFQY